MSLKWKYFLSKRRLTPSAFMVARGISSYDRLVKVLTQLEVEVPPFDEVGHLFLKKNQVDVPALEQVEEITTDSVVQVTSLPVENEPVHEPAAVPDVQHDTNIDPVPEVIAADAHVTTAGDKSPFRRRKSNKASSEELPSTGSPSENEGA